MNATTKLVVITAVGALVAVLIFFFLINPVLAELPELNGRLKEKKTELITLEQQIQAFRNAQSDLARATRKEEIAAALVNKENLVLAVQNIEAAATAANSEHTLAILEDLLLQKIKPEPLIANKTGLEEIPYRLTTMTDYLGTIDILRYLEHLPQFTEISKIDLSAELVESVESRDPVRTGQVLGTIDGVFFLKDYEIPKD